MVNPDKTDVLWYSTSQPPPDTPLSPAGTTVQPSVSVRNLGVLLDAGVSLTAHVSQLTGRCNCSLRRIKSCRRALSRSALVILVNSLIVSRLDYCDSRLAGCSKHLVDKLQRVLNCAARLIFKSDRLEHLTPLLRDRLHWLRARQRITFKLCLFVYEARNGIATSCTYVSQIYSRCSPLSGPWRPRHPFYQTSSWQSCILRRWSYTAWNSLPSDIRTASTLSTFKKRLKTHLFLQSYFVAYE